MNKSLLFIILFGIFNTLISRELNYKSNNTKKSISETFTHMQNGLIYNYTDNKKNYQILLETNENHASMGLTNIYKDKTNTICLYNNHIVTYINDKKEYINLKNLELIVFPEIQLQEFIKNKQLTNIKYMTISHRDDKYYTAIATKIPEYTTNINNIPHTKVEIEFENISPKFVKFIYYFDQNGIATLKEGYFVGSKKPQMSLIKK